MTFFRSFKTSFFFQWPKLNYEYLSVFEFWRWTAESRAIDSDNWRLRNFVLILNANCNFPRKSKQMSQYSELLQFVNKVKKLKFQRKPNCRTRNWFETSKLTWIGYFVCSYLLLFTRIVADPSRWGVHDLQEEWLCQITSGRVWLGLRRAHFGAYPFARCCSRLSGRKNSSFALVTLKILYFDTQQQKFQRKRKFILIQNFPSSPHKLFLKINSLIDFFVQYVTLDYSKDLPKLKYLFQVE